MQSFLLVFCYIVNSSSLSPGSLSNAALFIHHFAFFILFPGLFSGRFMVCFRLLVLCTLVKIISLWFESISSPGMLKLGMPRFERYVIRSVPLCDIYLETDYSSFGFDISGPWRIMRL